MSTRSALNRAAELCRKIADRIRNLITLNDPSFDSALIWHPIETPVTEFQQHWRLCFSVHDLIPPEHISASHREWYQTYYHDRVEKFGTDPFLLVWPRTKPKSKHIAPRPIGIVVFSPTSGKLAKVALFQSGKGGSRAKWEGIACIIEDWAEYFDRLQATVPEEPTEQNPPKGEAIASAFFPPPEKPEGMERKLPPAEPQTHILEPMEVAMLSSTRLAKLFNVNPEALRKRLDTWRTHNADGWVENGERKPREPKYLYCLKHVRPIIDALKSSGERPEK